MADVIDKINKLIRLATSGNENEARNSALKAALLIIEHKVVLTLPGVSAPTGNPPPVPPPAPPRPVAPRKAKDIHGHVWFFHEHGARFSGPCAFCGLPTMLGHATYVSHAGDALHVGCWNERQKGKTRPGPAPGSSRPVVENMRPTREDQEAHRDAIEDLFSRMGIDK